MGFSKKYFITNFILVFVALLEILDDDNCPNKNKEEDETTDDLLKEVFTVSASMACLKKDLLDQQNFVKKLIQETETRSAVATAERSDLQNSYIPEEEEVTPENSLIIGTNFENSSNAMGTRHQICPMCEANFPVLSNTHEDFVNHVNSHFSFEEEGDTIHNYEIVDPNEAGEIQ